MVHMACRLPLLAVIVLFLLLSFLFCNIKSLLVYERQHLLDLCLSAIKLAYFDRNEQNSGSPPLLADVPVYLLCAAHLPTQRP